VKKSNKNLHKEILISFGFFVNTPGNIILLPKKNPIYEPIKVIRSKYINSLEIHIRNKCKK